MMDWNDLRYFLAVARGGSLTRAAADLATTQSTISRRITALEAALGVVLFTRHASGYLLTDEGNDLVARAEAMEDAALTIHRDLAGRDSEASGTVRLATSHALADHFVLPSLKTFATTHPAIRVEIAVGVDYANLTRREADMALRLSRPERGNLVARRLATIGFGIFAARSLVATLPKPLNPFDGSIPAIFWDEARKSMAQAAWEAEHLGNSPIAVTVDTVSGQIAAARAGLGMVALPCYAVRPEDDLICLAGPDRALTREMFLVIHREVRSSARVSALADHLVATARRESARLDGIVDMEPNYSI